MRAIPLLAALLLTACGPTVVVDRLSNGQVVLIRSPQPEPEDLESLRQTYGLQTVINLRGADVKDNPDLCWFVKERDYCVKNKLGYFVMDFGDGTRPPHHWDLQVFNHLMTHEKFWPVLIHCQAGIHRTGFLAAYYRVKFNGWSPERAIEEMESYWYDWSLSDRSAIKDYLRSLSR